MFHDIWGRPSAMVAAVQGQAGSIFKPGAVHQLIQAGFSVNAPSSMGMTALHAAVRNNNLQFIDLLMSLGADMEAMNCHHQTPIFQCLDSILPLLYSPVVTFFRCVVEHGARLAPGNVPRASFLHQACERKSLVFVRCALLEDVSLVRCVDDLGMTPLMWALGVTDENYAIVRWLLAFDADAAVRDRDGRTPLHHAAAQGDEKTIRLILESTGDADVNTVDNDGLTPLHEAMSFFDDSTVILLMSHGAQVEVLDEDNETALFHACRWDEPNLFENLFHHDPDINFRRRNIDNHTPLDIAEMSGSRRLANALRRLENGTIDRFNLNVSVRDSDGNDIESEHEGEEAFEIVPDVLETNAYPVPEE